MGAIELIICDANKHSLNTNYTASFAKMNKRGPDDTVFIYENNVNLNKLNDEMVNRNLTRREILEYKNLVYVLGFHRLSTNDTTAEASQPFEDPIMHKISEYPDLRLRPKRKLMCNGEIYNYNELLKNEQFTDKDLRSNCDVEIILPLYIKYGIDETIKKLDGDYTFVITENLNTFKLNQTNIYVVRDKLGTRSLYMVKHKTNLFYMFVSEIKAIPSEILNNKDYYITEVPPGSYWSYNNSIINKNANDFIRYYNWDENKSLYKCSINTTDPMTIANIYTNIRSILKKSIEKRFDLSDIKVGVLLSGGFDSGIILSVLIKMLKERNYDFITNPIYSFTIGDISSNDVIKAQECIEYLENKYNIDIHHHIVSIDNSNDQLLEMTTEIIEDLETYAPKIIKNSIPLKYLMKYISENTDVKILLTGEGLDEICGYKEFEGLSEEEFQIKSVELIKNLSKFDLLRADKLASAHGLELRHPFLDCDFLEYMLSIHPKLKKPQIYKSGEKAIEKYIVRKAFDIDDKLLNESVLWRRIDDCSNNTEILNPFIEYIESLYSDNEYYNFLKIYSDKKVYPKNKEEMHYMKIFNNVYNITSNTNIISKFWRDVWN